MGVHGESRRGTARVTTRGASAPFLERVMTEFKMTGEDLVKQEEHELQYDREYFNTLDRVDRRDRRGEIVSFLPTAKYRNGFDKISWR